MALRKIVLYGQPILRMTAKPVTEPSEDLSTLISDMIETMQDEEGIGLAAPQVGESIALCVINQGLIEDDSPTKAYLNPVILQSEGTNIMEEGCLSIPDIREDVERPEAIRLRYMDMDGVQREEECDGMLARVLQHEIDHL
ncbi:peptide deformylase, partial [bacterium]|nr:peptide deformylase [bacterium]